MRCVIHVNHPAHVHLFKNLIYLLKKNGSEVIVIASKKNLTFELLELFGIKYIDIGSYGNTIREKLINVPIIDLRTLNIIKKYSPDIFIGMGSIVNSHVSSLLNKPCVNFTDTEHSVEQLILYYFFTNYIVTPNSFKKYLGQKHVRYNGYQELAYLHPNWFTPDKNILNKINMTVDDKIIVIRLVKWNSTHDIKHHGIENKFALIDELKDHANIIITSEEKDKRLEKFSYNLSPTDLHHLLYFSSLYIGDGGTTASEAAILGTHSIHISTKAKYVGNFTELNSYDLLYTFEDQSDAITLAKKLLKDNNLKRKGKEKRKILIGHKIDVTKFMYDFIIRVYAEFR